MMAWRGTHLLLNQKSILNIVGSYSLNRSLLLSFPYLLQKGSLLPFLGKQSHSSPDSRAISLVTSALA